MLVTNKFNRRFNLVPTTTTMEKKIRPVNVLLVEDNPGDVRLTQEAFKEAKISIKLDVTMDGVDAIKFLRKEAEYSGVNTPDLILLDLNLPKKDGREVLKEIKTDNLLKKIPVVVLTTSNAEQDIMKSYNLHVNCYINKPVDFEKFFKSSIGIKRPLLVSVGQAITQSYFFLEFSYIFFQFITSIESTSALSCGWFTSNVLLS